MHDGLARAMGASMAMEECSAKQAIECRQPTIKEELIRKKGRYEAQLADINDAIAALDSNPQVETVLNLIAKTGRY